ncbi:MAG TPA: hypothetical protein VFM94_00095 [Solirubrobacterales bacterium]|nr:hypothetical protein [Solirubrobacterales bacterium]
MNSHLRDGEKGHCHTCAGTLLRPDWTTRDFVAATQSETRDAFFFGNQRVMVLMPRPAKPMGLRRAFRAARGDRDAFGDMREFARDAVTGFTLSPEAPLEGTQMQMLFKGDFNWLTVRLAGGEELRMLLDEVADPNGDLEARLDDYFSGGNI